MKADRLHVSAFTLIEMLIVITIIGILAGLLTTAVAAAMRKARETRASAEARQVATAWERYYAEYSVWPSGLGGTEGSAFDVAENCTNMLSGADVPANANPKKICFFQTLSKDLKDPWRRSYRYMLDLNFDGKITTPWGEVVGRSAIAWSAGVDGVNNTRDDLYSWK